MRVVLNIEHHDDHLHGFLLEYGWIIEVDGPRLKYRDPKNGDLKYLQIAAETMLNRLVYEAYDRSDIKAEAIKKPPAN